MKISKIKLNRYFQFQDISIDLTYPLGHEKEGQPLDKVCLIGQSGTGKTSLLRLIKWFVSGDRRIDEVVELKPLPTGNVEMEFQLSDLHFKMYSSEKSPYLRPIFPGGDNLRFSTRIINHFNETNPILIHFPNEIISDRFFKEVDPYKIEDRSKEKKTKKDIHPFGVFPKIVDFAFHDPLDNWQYALKDIIDYRTSRLFFSNEITNLKNQPGTNDLEIKKKEREYKKWLDTHRDPLKILADECLDEILEKVGLKVKMELDMPSIRNPGYIQLRALNGEAVPGEFWSTGTGQIVMTILPLFQLKPQNAIILIDEPERSLYPDIQMETVPLFTRHTRDSQFFFATHSPIIASAFEPWEIVEFKFDKEHRQVYIERLYEGENHIKNYRFFPEYLRWDSILLRLFELKSEGGKKRNAKLYRLAELNVRIRKLKENKNEKKLNKQEEKTLEKLYEEVTGIRKELDWEPLINRNVQ
jgi:hypothetical protein